MAERGEREGQGRDKVSAASRAKWGLLKASARAVRLVRCLLDAALRRRQLRATGRAGCLVWGWPSPPSWTPDGARVCALRVRVHSRRASWCMDSGLNKGDLDALLVGLLDGVVASVLWDAEDLVVVAGHRLVLVEGRVARKGSDARVRKREREGEERRGGKRRDSSCVARGGTGEGRPSRDPNRFRVPSVLRGLGRQAEYPSSFSCTSPRCRFPLAEALTIGTRLVVAPDTHESLRRRHSSWRSREGLRSGRSTQRTSQFVLEGSSTSSSLPSFLLSPLLYPIPSLQAACRQTTCVFGRKNRAAAENRAAVPTQASRYSGDIADTCGHLL